MSQDLLTQLAEYGTYCEERQGSVLADDVIDAVVPLPMPTRPPQRRRGWLAAAAAAAAILVLIGGAALFSRPSDEPGPPAEPTATTVLPTESTVATAADPSDALSILGMSRPQVTDFSGVIPGDSGEGPLPLGTVNELSEEAYLNFLFGSCRGCDPDASFVNPENPRMGSGTWTAERPFQVRHGFMNDSEAPLGPGFSVALYVTLYDEVDEAASGSFLVGQTYKFTPDYVQRGVSDQCGPTYESQPGPVSCEWFVHDFPDGLPFGRYELVAVWEAPCSAWVELGFTETCDDPAEPISLFASSVDSGLYNEAPDFSNVNGATGPVPTEANQDVSGVGTVTDILPISVQSPEHAAAVFDGAIWITDGTLTRIDTRSVTTEIVDVGLSAHGALVADEALWVWSRDGAISRIDPASREVTDTVSISGDIWQALVVEADNAIWVRSGQEESGHAKLSRVDLATRRVTDEYALTRRFWWMVATEDAIWLYFPSQGAEMHRFDLATNQITDVVNMHGYEYIEKPSATVVGEGIWMTGGDGYSVRLDISSKELTTEVPADGSKPLLAGGVLYMPARETGSVLLVDLSTQHVIGTIQVGLQPATPIAAAGSIWVPNLGDGTVTRIDPVSREVMGAIVIGGDIDRLVASEGAVWVLGDAVTRIEIP